MCVGELDNQRLVACKTQYMPDYRRDREILLPLRRQALRREFILLGSTAGQARERISAEGRCTGFGQRNFQLLELDISARPPLDMGRMLDLIDDRIKRAVRMVRRALIADCDMRLCVDPFQKDFANSRLADAGFTAQKRDLTSAGFGSIPQRSIAAAIRAAGRQIA